MKNINFKNFFLFNFIANSTGLNDITNISFRFVSNLSYFLFFFFVLLSFSGSFFEINSNFLLFFLFTFFFLVIYYVFTLYSFFFYTKTNPYFILDLISQLITNNIISLYYIKYAIINNNLIFFKNIFIYVKSSTILVYFSTLIPIEISLNVRNFLLAKFK